MSIPHQCPHCETTVETEAASIEGIGSRRIACPACDEPLVAKPCPGCAADDATDAADCAVCDGDEVVLVSLDELLS